MFQISDAIKCDMGKKKSHDTKISTILQGISLLLLSLFLGLSILSFHDNNPEHNWLGLFGHILSWSFCYTFGLASFIIPPFLAWIGWKIVTRKAVEIPRLKIVCFPITLISLSVLLAMAAEGMPKLAHYFDSWVHSDYYPKNVGYASAHFRNYLGGVPFHHLYMDLSWNLHKCLGGLGTFLLSSTLFLISGTVLTSLPVATTLKKIKKPVLNLSLKLPKRAEPFKGDEVDEVEFTPPPLSREDPLKKVTRIKLPEPPVKKTEPEPIPLPPKNLGNGEYSLPPPSLLTEVKQVDQSALKNDLRRQAVILEETFLSFGIEAKVGDIHCGPTITSFEVHPAVGVKVQKIKTLENDIALNMQAKSIRIIAPIPGKAAVGIEVPNPHPQEVGFRELIENYHRANKTAHIPLLLGKLVNGDDVWADLTKMPHLIIAGATGSGKSVCINTIVMSILMNARPDEIKLVMVDPKKVELTAYTHLPHMLAPVITEPPGALSALNWLVREMEKRYEIFRQLGIRNILAFNTRKVNQELETSLDLNIPERMPYIVLIIDELADLMMVSSADIETPIARIAQMARAVGIHMILATQRPSREVITGLIKANFPSRIAFKVSSRVNSQIIIDDNGADCLLGNGDMLFLPPGTSTLIRAQGAFIRDEDINKTIHYICSQAPTNYLIPSFDNYRDPLDMQMNEEPSERDSLYEETKKLVLETGTASTTFIQRKLKIGYARAASLMDQLEETGIIGPSEGAKPRKIFYPNEES